ncbi:MAG: MFS transporter [Alphaproteobacteria bacterium]|nr:MFS transporter [Alphaproteobacteria bacterium]
MSIPAPRRLPMRLKLIHSLGSIAYGVKDNGFSTFLLLFYNQVLGLQATLVSTALMIALFIDAVIDPFVGHMSDRTYTRWGRRLPWLYAAPIPLGLAWLLLWAPPEAARDHIFLYLVITSVLVRALVSACEVPSVALVPELTSDYDERTSVMRLRYLFGWAGGLLMLFLAYSVFLVPDSGHKVGQLNPEGYWLYGVFGGVLIAVAVLFSALGQHKVLARLPDARPGPSSLRHAFDEIRESLSNRAFLIFAAAAVFATISQGITFSISNYLYLYVWKFDQTAFAIYPVVLFFSVIAAVFLVVPLNRRWDKPHTAAYGSLIGLGFWIVPFVLRLMGYWPDIGSSASNWGVFFFFFLGNSFAVTVMISASSMIADIVENGQEETGRRSEGVFFAGNFFIQKCATGVGIFASGLIISWAGLSVQTPPNAVLIEVIDRLTLSYIGLITLLAVASAAIFVRFPIRRADHEARLARLAQGAAQKAG